MIKLIKRGRKQILMFSSNRTRERQSHELKSYLLSSCVVVLHENLLGVDHELLWLLIIAGTMFSNSCMINEGEAPCMTETDCDLFTRFQRRIKEGWEMMEC